VPGSIRRLENQRVTIQGFMIPTRTADRKVSEFLLVRSQASCCFGMPPGVSDVLAIHMAGKPADPLMDRPVNVTGQLHVQEQWAGTSLSSLYQMEAECVASGSSQPSLKLVRGTWDLMMLRFTAPGQQPRYFPIPLSQDIRTGVLRPKWRLTDALGMTWDHLPTDGKAPDRIP
jgi:hypothetical protein